MKGSLVLYRMLKERGNHSISCRSILLGWNHQTGNPTYEQAYNMLLMNVLGEVVRGVSMTYATTVGMLEAIDSVIIDPEADQVKISI
jgi:hypothetical protein